MPQSVIAVDLDDTLIETITPYRAFARQVGVLAPDADILEHVQLSDAQSDDYHELEALRPVDAVPGAAEVCRALAGEGVRLHVVTARHPRFSEKTERLVERVFPGLFSGVVCTGGCKAEALARLAPAALLDDGPWNIEAVERIGIPSVLFGWLPWNREVSHVRRARNWEEADLMLRTLLPRRRRPEAAARTGIALG